VINEPISKLSYVLNCQNNVAIYGNTVYAWDLAGIVGASETAYFNVRVPEPFSVVPVAAASYLFLTKEIKVGKRQTLDTLISEEALLFDKYLRNQRKDWIPRLSLPSCL